MFNGSKDISAQELLVVSTVQQERLGTLGRTADNRWFRYGKAGASLIAAGSLAVAEATVANHTNLALAADAAAGAKQITVTLGATAATADQYTEGSVTINAGTGKGIALPIRGHGAAASSGSLIVYLEVPLPVALTSASSKASLAKSPWKDVVASATASLAAGVPNVAIAAASFGWLQTHGTASVLSDGIIAKGKPATQSLSVAGAVKTVDVTSATTANVTTLGVAPEATVDTELRNVVLSID